MIGFSLVNGVKKGTAAEKSLKVGSSPPASNSTTLWPALARLHASGPPPAPEPTTMYSTGASGGSEAPIGAPKPSTRRVPAAMPAASTPRLVTNARRDQRDGGSDWLVSD